MPPSETGIPGIPTFGALRLLVAQEQQAKKDQKMIDNSVFRSQLMSQKWMKLNEEEERLKMKTGEEGKRAARPPSRSEGGLPARLPPRRYESESSSDKTIPLEHRDEDSDTDDGSLEFKEVMNYKSPNKKEDEDFSVETTAVKKKNPRVKKHEGSFDANSFDDSSVEVLGVKKSKVKKPEASLRDDNSVEVLGVRMSNRNKKVDAKHNPGNWGPANKWMDCPKPITKIDLDQKISSQSSVHEMDKDALKLASGSDYSQNKGYDRCLPNQERLALARKTVCPNEDASAAIKAAVGEEHGDGVATVTEESTFLSDDATSKGGQSSMGSDWDVYAESYKQHQADPGKFEQYVREVTGCDYSTKEFVSEQSRSVMSLMLYRQVFSWVN